MDRIVVSVIYVLCTVAFLRFCEGDAESSVKRGYVFTAPNQLLAGEIERGCLSLHNLEPPAHILLELVPSPLIAGEEGEVVASTSAVLKSGVETCLELMVPSKIYYYGILRLKVTFEKYPDYVIQDQKDVSIEHNSMITFVETDKTIYKPGQDVNIRVLMLKHDLKPWTKNIPKIWIENPSGVRVAQWTNVSLELGMVQLTFPLSPEPNSGTWKIEVEKKKSQVLLIHTTTFEVKKYVLPRFQLKINAPKYVLADAENVTWNICAKYSYGEPVKGNLILKSTVRETYWGFNFNLSRIHYTAELDTPSGCTDFTVPGSALGLGHLEMIPYNIVFTANFTEAGTGVVETATSSTVVERQALKLQFLQYMPKYFALGLPYHGKLKVSKQDDTPAANEEIQLFLNVHRKEHIEYTSVHRNFTSSVDGYVDFIVPPQYKDVFQLTFVASIANYQTKYLTPVGLWRTSFNPTAINMDVKAWYSPSDSYLAVTQGYQSIVCGEKYSFNVMYTMPANHQGNESISFHYSINSKGDLLIYGHVKHTPTRDTVLHYSDFNNLLGTVETPANGVDEGSVVHRFPLSVKVTPSMAPISELLLYYVRADGEIVATTYTIEVGHCFENKVKSAWHTEVEFPGHATQYHVEAAPWSLCGISAVDKSTHFLANSKTNLINANKVFYRLDRFHPYPRQSTRSPCKQKVPPESNGEEIDHLPHPAVNIRPRDYRRRRRHIRHIYPFNDYADSMQAFIDFGVTVMTDLVLVTRRCPPMRIDVSFRALSMDSTDGLQQYAIAAAAMGSKVEYVDQISTVRSYFPETWLWELVPTGKEGKITIERMLPHTITDWVGHTVCISPTHGLGIAPPTTITAFQSFFLDYSLPYSVKRGELLRMKVSLFNYMHHSLPVKIKLVGATGLDLHLSHAVASFCVKPRDSVVHEYILRPRVLGEVNITVAAHIDPDYPEQCGPKVLVFMRDTIVKPILILPEGFPVDVTKSAFICPKDFSDDSAILWNLELPEDLVPDSARAHISLIGDILGSAIENLDNLVRLPIGCGEQNMILFVPNIHVIRYLDAVGTENPELRARAIKNMEKGYQRELYYRHPDGSYSAFGPESGTKSSIWLTAFVVKSFAQARTLIHIDDRDLKLSVNWIVKRQLGNGCFPVVGRVFHQAMKGGLTEDDSSSALTAYILISLLESGVPLTASLINNALYCLEEGMANSNDDPYTAALSTYALALLEHPIATSNMKSLINRATRNHDLLWWEDKFKPSLGLSIEMTAYAILSLVKLGGDENMVEAVKAVRWMSKQRNAEGGFTSTQDTVLGLEALTKYASTINNNNTDLSVLVTAVNVDQIYRMHNDNRMVLTQIRLPVLPTIIEIFAEGEGCVLIQSNLRYNVAHATGSEAFDLSVVANPAAGVDECSMQKILICARYKMADEESNMALLEIGMISGYVPDRASLHSLLKKTGTTVKRLEEDHGIVTIYFDKLISQKTCISFLVVRQNIVDRLEPANVKLYDYYHQELTVSSSYKFAQTCSSADADEGQPIPTAMIVKTEVSQVESGSGLTPDEPDRNFNPVSSNPSTVQTKDTAEFPSFVVVSHELEIPDGIEGPVPAYAKPDANFDNNPISDIVDYKLETTVAVDTTVPFTSTPRIENEDLDVTTVVQEQELERPDLNATSMEDDVSRLTDTIQSCPTCAEKLPSDIIDIYCSASSAIKVAIRRLRKARLLLDLHPLQEVQRLHATIEFTLNSNCSCLPLDTPGSLALVINKNNSLTTSGNYQMRLEESFSIYGLPSIGGVPRKITEARSVCSSQETN